MQGGRLRHLAVFDKPVSTQTTTGAEVIQWVPTLRTMVAIEPLSGRELLALGAVGSEATTRVRLRWSPRIGHIDTKWRLRNTIDGQQTIYNITSISTLETRQREVQMLVNSGLDVLAPSQTGSVT